MSEEYVRASGDAECPICGRTYYRHETVKRYDSFDGQEMELVRACDGRLLKL